MAGTGETMNIVRFGAAPILVTLAAALGLSVPDAGAQAPAAQQRPRIGLVLAGGGAKGGAHIGALKVLEELHVPVDCIAGTSIGALVGAGYATGQPASQIEKFVSGIDWATVIGGAGRRKLEPIEQKRLSLEGGSNVQMGLIDGKVVTPSGLADSSSIDDLLRGYVARARTVADFNELPIPFRAVATDMLTGDMVVLDHGDIATAMRASMAIPGAFSPVVLDPWILSDGGMVRNIPIDVARATCADVVIVVNLVEPAPTREKLVQATQLLSRSMDVMFEVNEKAQLATLTERDILINVPMGDIGTADFDRLPETIPLGETAARKATDRLRALSVPEPEYLAWRKGVTQSQDVEIRVADVKVDGLDFVNPRFLQSMMQVDPGDAVTIDDISQDARRIAALNEIDSVAYRIDGPPEASTLTWLPSEISLGQSTLRPALGLFADGGGDFRFLLGVQHVRAWINDLGAQWRNQLQIGNESMIRTSFYQPLDVEQRWFVEPEAFAERVVEDIYDDGDRLATYEFFDFGGRADLGWNLSRYAQLRLGYLYDQRKTHIDTGPPALPAVDDTDAGLTFSARYDSRDTPSFSRSGVAASVRYERMDGSLGSDRDWERIEAGVRKAISIGKYVTWLSLAGGSDLDSELPADRLFSLGGPRVLPAFQYDEIRASDYWVAESSFLRQLKVLSPIKNQAIYAGLGLQAVGLHDRLDVPGDDDEVVYGGYLFLAGPTALGTFTLGAGYSDGDANVWLSLGKPTTSGTILDDALFR
jgi:NTE family protein